MENTRKYIVLCVDDEQAVLNQLAAQLEEHFQYFCEFEYAESAEEALVLYQNLKASGYTIWLVISDQIMPGMPGDEFLAKLHDMDRHAMKVLLTGQAGLDATIKAINHAGLHYYIEKPWSKHDLILILDRLRTQYEVTVAQRTMAIEREKWLKELSILYDMNMLFASSIDLRETLNTVFYNIVNVIQAEAGSIFLTDDFDNSLVCKICQGPTDITGLKVPIGKGIVGHVAKTRQIDVTLDVKQNPYHYPAIDKESGFVTKSMISVPLISKDELLGVIQVINKKEDGHFSQDDVNLLQSLSSGAALALQNARFAQRLLQEERIRSELLIAHQIQQGILPASGLTYSGVHFEAVNYPAKSVGGDFYDYFELNNEDVGSEADQVGFFIGDVCGKGIPAALFMASARSSIKAQAVSGAPPAEIMNIANHLIAQDAKHGMFVTVFYGIYHSRDRMLHFSNAGHTLPYLYRASQQACASLFNTNFPLGVLAPLTYQESSIQLEVGDKLILYTDGVNETLNAARQQFGLERLVDLILANGHRPAKELLDIILARVQEFAEEQGLADDMTIMVAHIA